MKPEQYFALVVGGFQPSPLLIEVSRPDADPERLSAVLLSFETGDLARERGQAEAERIRSAVLRNPNLPRAEFWDYMASGSPDIWVNPAMDLFLLENPRPFDVLLPYLCRAAMRLVDPPMARLSASWWPEVATEHLRVHRVGGHPFWAKWEATLRDRLDAPTPSPEASR